MEAPAPGLASPPPRPAEAGRANPRSSPARSDWLHEVKHDSFRVLAWKQGERVKVWSRRGADFTDQFSGIAVPDRVHSGVPCRSAALRPRPSDQLLNFGCVGHGGSPLLLALILCCHRSSLSSPFPSRRSSWKAELSADREPVPSRRGRRRSCGFSPASTEFCSAKRWPPRGVFVFTKACGLGLEVMVSKRRGSFYKSGLAATG